MRRASRVLTSLLTCAALGAGLSGIGPNGAEAAASTTTTPDRHADVRAGMDATVDGGIPGVLAAVSDDHGTWRGGSGVGNVHTRRAVRPDGRFRIASVSKPFTATLVLQLAQEGRIGLDDPIAEYLPGLLPYTRPITVRQLLQHTSGLPRDLPPEHTWATPAEIHTERFTHFRVEDVVKLGTDGRPLLFEPGTSWAYSNIGYSVLAMLVEQVTDRPLERVLHKRIIRPLGLHDTVLVRDFPLLVRAATRGYEQLYPAPHGLTDVTTYNYSRYVGSGSMLSSATDLNRFFAALLTGRLLDDAMLAQMKRTVPAVGPDGGYAGFDYGLGLMRLPLTPWCADGPVVWGHDGSLPGYGVFSVHTERADTQITTVVNRNTTAPLEAAVAWTGTMATPFCAPDPATTTLEVPEQRSAPESRLLPPSMRYRDVPSVR